jgi:hypothetical protein
MYRVPSHRAAPRTIDSYGRYDSVEYVFAVVVGITSSIAASALWLVILGRFQPKIEISPEIAEDHDESAAPGRFRIKIINRRRRPAADLRFELSVITPKRTRYGYIKVRKVVPLRNDPPLIIPGRAKHNDDDNAYRIRVSEDLRAALSADERVMIRFRVYARDAISGIGKVFERTYFDPDCDIRRGDFGKGQTFEIASPQQASISAHTEGVTV